MKKIALLICLLLVQGFARAEPPATHIASEAPTTPPSTTQPSVPVGVTEGLRLTITAAKPAFAKGEAIHLLVAFTNTQTKPVLLYDPRQESQWVVSCRSADGKSYVAAASNEAGMTPGEVELKPGAKHDGLQRAIGRWTEAFGAQGEVLTELPPGKYTVQATFVPLRPASTGPTAYWTAHLTSNPVEFEITDRNGH